MAQVTMELRHALQLRNDDGTPFQLFDFTYKCDDAAWKAELEQAIIDHYAYHEIGQETVDRWKQRFKTRFQRIMPFYNELHNSTLLDYNPLLNYKLTEAMDGSRVNTGTVGTDNTMTEYPQHTDITQDIPSGRSQNTTTNNLTEANDYTKTVEGLTGTSYPELIKQHRDNLLRVNDLIINEMKPAFILVY